MGEGASSTLLPFILILAPSKDEDAPRTIRRCVRVWIPAFVGNTGWGGKARPPSTLRATSPSGGSTGKAGVGGGFLVLRHAPHQANQHHCRNAKGRESGASSIYSSLCKGNGLNSLKRGVSCESLWALGLAGFLIDQETSFSCRVCLTGGDSDGNYRASVGPAVSHLA